MMYFINLNKKPHCFHVYTTHAQKHLWHNGEALPGVLGIQGERLFIFRDLGRRDIYFQGFGEFLGF